LLPVLNEAPQHIDHRDQGACVVLLAKHATRQNHNTSIIAHVLNVLQRPGYSEFVVADQGVDVGRADLDLILITAKTAWQTALDPNFVEDFSLRRSKRLKLSWRPLGVFANHKGISLSFRREAT